MTGVFVGKWENINRHSLHENMYLPYKMKTKLFQNMLQVEQNSLPSHTIFIIIAPNIIHQLVTILYRNRQEWGLGKTAMRINKETRNEPCYEICYSMNA
jgi:hypothetical protein